jgi:hypothetical protein
MPQNSFVRSKEHVQQRNGVKGDKQLLNINANLKKTKEHLLLGYNNAAVLSEMVNTQKQQLCSYC